MGTGNSEEECNRWLSCESADEDKNDDDDDWCQKPDVEYPNSFEPESGISEGDFLQGIFDSPDVGDKNTYNQRSEGQNDVAENQVHVAHEIPLCKYIHPPMRQSGGEAEKKTEKTHKQSRFFSWPISLVDEIGHRNFQHGDSGGQGCHKDQEKKEDAKKISAWNFGDNDGEDLKHQSPAGLEFIRRNSRRGKQGGEDNDSS